MGGVWRLGVREMLIVVNKVIFLGKILDVWLKKKLYIEYFVMINL